MTAAGRTEIKNRMTGAGIVWEDFVSASLHTQWLRLPAVHPVVFEEGIRNVEVTSASRGRW